MSMVEVGWVSAAGASGGAGILKRILIAREGSPPKPQRPRFRTRRRSPEARGGAGRGGGDRAPTLLIREARRRGRRARWSWHPPDACDVAVVLWLAPTGGGHKSPARCPAGEKRAGGDRSFSKCFRSRWLLAIRATDQNGRVTGRPWPWTSSSSSSSSAWPGPTWRRSRRRPARRSR